MSDDRINNLEEKLAHQELAVQELSDEIFQQQQALVRLEGIVVEMNERLKSLSEKSDGSSVDEAPPHY